MTEPKLLSAALIAAAMIATPAMARQSHVTSRQPAADAYAGIYTDITPNARYLNGPRCIPAPRVGAFASQPWDNDIPCAPTSAY
jgi:hypothetical protein